eukprot:COSAG01_NODE_1820_length_9152_cov_22.869215_10_plen_391_part_00
MGRFHHSLTQIYLCHACSCQEILRAQTAHQAANQRRKAVPWIIVTSHYPINKPSSMDGQAAEASLRGWYSEAGEACVDGVCDGTEFMSCEEAGEEAGCRTVSERDAVGQGVGELFNRYGVDIYNAGHAHIYEVTWPMLSNKQDHYQQNYTNPQGTVYIIEGNGAVPGTGPNTTLTFYNSSIPSGRVHGTGGAYGIITTSSTDKLTYEHVINNGNGGQGKVMDTWSLTEATHVQPLPPAPSPRPPAPPSPSPAPAPPPTGCTWTCFQDQQYDLSSLNSDDDPDRDSESSVNECLRFTIHSRTIVLTRIRIFVGWSRYTNKGATKLKDKQQSAANLTACERTCNAAMGCVAVRYHETDAHCHMLIGPRPTLTAFRKLLKPCMGYSCCIMVKQ